MEKHRVLKNILIALACTGLALTVFALFHHVLPRPRQSLGIVIGNPYRTEMEESSGSGLALPDGALLIAEVNDHE